MEDFFYAGGLPALMTEMGDLLDRSQLTVNGKTHEVDAEADTPLLWVLRDQLGLTGTKYGCGIARCGSCTVYLDGEPVRSCITPVSAALGKQITTIEGLAELRTPFRVMGKVTAGNSSGLNDGAAGCLLMAKDVAKDLGIDYKMQLEAFAYAGVKPEIMGIGPKEAIPRVLKQTGIKQDEIDWIELNEAFAAQYIACERGLGIDRAKVNVNGGAIAIGHPIGASGCRVLNTLLFEMKRRDAKKGLATLCIGGGMGVAVCVERD